MKPRIRSPENAALVCDLIAQGWMLKQIAAKLGCTLNAITEWRRDDPEFAVLYAQAKEIQADHFAEEIAQIADEGTNDWMEREGVMVPDHEHIQRSRLRVDTRKWLMSKMAPKRYGEKQAIEHTGKDGEPLIPADEGAKTAQVLLNMLSKAKPEDEPAAEPPTGDQSDTPRLH